MFSNNSKAFPGQNLITLKKLSSCTSEDFFNIYDEDIHIHCGEKVHSDLFKIGDSTKYLIFEKFVEKETKYEDVIENIGTLQISSTPIKKTEDVSSYPNLDVTGSPLPCHFKQIEELGYSFEDIGNSTPNTAPIYNGFDLTAARSLFTSLYRDLKILKLEGLELPAIWIACDGNNAKKVVFIGVCVSEVNITCTMMSHEPYLSRQDLPSLDHFCSMHLFGESLSCMKTNAKAVYDVIVRDKSTSMKLHTSWDRPLSTLCTPKMDSFSVASIHLGEQELCDPGFFIQRELDILGNLISGLDEKCLKVYENLDGTSVEVKLRNFLNAFHELDTKHKGASDDNIWGLREIASGTATKLRSKLAFPDHVWKLLKGCQTFSSLRQGLLAVFGEIYSGNIRPQIFMKDKTEFAEICRDLMKFKKHIPSIEGASSLQILIQIGLEKIRSDYAAVLKGWDLAITEQLLPFVDWSDIHLNYKKCFLRLQKLHLVIQAVIAFKVYLCLPNVVLTKITSEMLSKLKTSTELQRDFEFQLETSLIIKTFKSLDPKTWIFNAKIGDNISACWTTLALKRNEKFFLVNSADKMVNRTTIENDVDVEKELYYGLHIVKNACLI